MIVVSGGIPMNEKQQATGGHQWRSGCAGVRTARADRDQDEIVQYRDEIATVLRMIGATFCCRGLPNMQLRKLDLFLGEL
jgi:hypothetical protein